MAYVKISFCILLLLLTVSCGPKQDVTSVELVDAEVQITPITPEERIAILEGRIDLLSSELQTFAVGTHEVRTKTGEKTNYVVLPKDLNEAPDLSSTVHRVVPRPGTEPAIAANSSATARPTMKNNRPKPVVATASATLPSTAKGLSLPPASASPQATLPGAKPVQESPSLSLPPETIVAAATVPVANQTSLVKPNTNTKAATQAVKPSPNLGTGMEAAYKNALNTALAGKFNAAISLFETYLQNFPNSKYVPNAYYWIGECLYAQKKFPEALLKFKEVSGLYPKHHKTADALLKAGMTYDLMGDTNNAALQYNALLDGFSNSNAAKIVRSWGYVR